MDILADSGREVIWMSKGYLPFISIRWTSSSTVQRSVFAHLITASNERENDLPYPPNELPEKLHTAICASEEPVTTIFPKTPRAVTDLV